MVVYFNRGALKDIDFREAVVNKNYGIADFDNFVVLENTFDATVGGYVSTGDTGGSVALVGLAPGSVLNWETGAADNDGNILQRQGSAAAFDIDLNSGRRVAYEARLAIVSGGEIAFFFGLAEEGLTKDLIVNDGATLEDKDYIGFWAKAHATDVDVDCVYRIEGGSQVDAVETVTEDDDGNYNTYGFVFDGKTTVDWYVNGVKVGTSTLTAATFPDDQALTPTMCIKNGEAAAKSVRVDYWKAVELQDPS